MRYNEGEFPANNTWYDPIFFVDGNDWATSIIYDDLEEDVRYCVIINHNYDDYNKHITIYYGTSDRGQAYESKSFTLVGKEYHTIYFVDYDNKGNLQPSSIKKFVSIVERLINLRAFL